MKRPCLTPGCGALTTTTRCAYCEAEYQRNRNASPQRMARYDADHRAARKALLAGGPWPCQWQYPGLCTHIATQADHVDGGYVRSCGPCNSSRARRKVR